ncbi:MAG: alcohol dehydrogenase catalytic domain-containing protein [Spirochaetales bacterium]|nr:alcohol dehydrogenase catalytic domain-containing protein [Spirochaetales bacterium]
MPTRSLEWPLYGAGVDKLGLNGQPVERNLPENGPDELLIRHDAVGLCFTDVKEIVFGDQHPRLIGRDLAANPVVPGHETSMTVIRVGEKLRDQYHVGDRFVIQPDTWYGGKSIPYSFGIDGAYRQYGVMGKVVLRGDEGSYLIPIPEDMSYAGAALSEPWACVEASYRMVYRTELKQGGNVWFFGNEHSRQGYRIGKIWDPAGKPALVVLTDVPKDLESRLADLCRKDDVPIRSQSRKDVEASGTTFHDIIVLDGSPEQVNGASALMANEGILAMTREGPMSGPVMMDVGRVHYDHVLYVGTTSLDLDAAYRETPVRCNLKPGGTTLVLGASGPMGRMHVQRAIESAEKPAVIIGTGIHETRLADLRGSFSQYAGEHQVELYTASPASDRARYEKLMRDADQRGGLDDVEVMAPSPEAIVEISQWVGTAGVVNIFAGLKRGTIAQVDPFLIYGPRQVRYVGHSGSKLGDQVAIVERYQRGELQPQRSVAAVCGMRQIAEGIRAMQNATYPGKIVVYPLVEDFPLTGLPELKTVLPDVYEALEGGSVWTNAAEELFLERTLS